MRSYLENKNRSVFNGVRFVLDNDIEGERQLATAPDGWTAEFVLERNTVLKGVFRQISDVTLQFVEDGKDYIEKVYKEQGVNATITMRVDYWNNNYEWENVFTGIVDLFTLRITDFSVDCQIEDNAALAKFMRRKKNEINLFKEKDLDGNVIPAYPFNQRLLLPEQQIETDSYLLAYEGIISTVGGAQLIYPFTLLSQSFAELQTPNINGANLKEKAFFREALTAYPAFKISYFFDAVKDVNDTLTLQFIIIDSNENIKETIGIVGVGNTTPIVSALGDKTLSLDVGDSILCIYNLDKVGPDPFQTFIFNGQVYDYLYIQVESPIIPEVDIKAVNILDAYKRLTLMTSGLNVVSSFYEYIGNNCSNLTSGKNIRGLDADLSLSLEKLAESSYAIHSAGVGFDGTNIVVEHIDHFYKPNVILDLTKRTDAYEIEVSDGYFSSIQVGYSKSSNNAKYGLGEPNTKSEYSTPINYDKSLKLLSPYRGDTTGVISLRENPAQGAQNDSTSGDDDVWLFDTIYLVVEDRFFVRQNQGFTLGPGGWYNLRNTPSRMARRHRIKEYLPYITQDIQLQQKDKFSFMTTRLFGEVGNTSENADIPVSDLPTPRWIPEIITGVANVERSEIKNLDPTGLVKVDEGLYGWIEKLVINYEQGKVEFELLRCNLDNVTPI